MYRFTARILSVVFILSLSIQAPGQAPASAPNPNPTWQNGVSGLRHLAVDSLIEHLSVYIENDQALSYWSDIPSKLSTPTQVVLDAELLIAQIKEGLEKVRASHHATEIFILHTHPKESIRSVYQRSPSSSSISISDGSLTLPPSRTDLDFIFSIKQHLHRLSYFELYQITQLSGVVVDPVGLYFFRTFSDHSERKQISNLLGIAYEEPPTDLEAEMNYSLNINKAFNASVESWIDFNKSQNLSFAPSELVQHYFQKLQVAYVNYHIGFLLRFTPY